MATCLLYRHRPARRARFYRIELAMNMFSQVSVLREWGISGGAGRFCISTYDNLREASLAADKHRQRMLKRGYDRL
jgi:predicted DNA-binding WGR domain protein